MIFKCCLVHFIKVKFLIQELLKQVFSKFIFDEILSFSKILLYLKIINRINTSLIKVIFETVDYSELVLNLHYYNFDLIFLMLI